MTGFGRSEKNNDSISITVEIKSVNSRFFDISTRLPRILSIYEDEVNKLIKDQCTRGRVSVLANIESLKGEIH